MHRTEPGKCSLNRREAGDLHFLVAAGEMGFLHLLALAHTKVNRRRNFHPGLDPWRCLQS